VVSEDHRPVGGGQVVELGVRFLTRSRVFDPAEQAWLGACAPAQRAPG
jgi:hypothetical protein